MTAIITTLKLKDWELYRALRLKSAETDPFASIPNEEEVAACPNDIWRAHLNVNYAHGAIFCAFEKDTPVGLISVHRKPNFKVKHVGVIEGLCVVPDSRNQGTGTMLLKEALQYFSEIGGIRTVELQVAMTSSIAIKLFEKFDFKIIGRHHEALHIGKDYFDVFSMEMKCEVS